MRGGKSVGIKRIGALRQVSAALLAIHMTWASSATTFCAVADAVDNDDQCVAQTPPEQSIVISAKKLVEGKAPLVMANDENDAEVALLPIAKVSDCQPDLADPLVAPTPTLADPLASSETADEKEFHENGRIAQLEATRAAIQKKRSVRATTAAVEAISFNGITPGISKRIDVLRNWGDPRSDDTQATELKYRFDDLRSVVVRFEDSQVDSIVVKLKKPQLITALIDKLDLESLRPAMMFDSDGVEVARVFPERGVVLRIDLGEQGLAIASDDEDFSADAGPRVNEIVIQSIQAAPFLLRAEQNPSHHFTKTIADLKAALRFDRSLGAVRAQLSEIQLKIGKAVTAERYASEAVELEPQNASYRLHWAKCLRQLARYERAVEEAREVLENRSISPLIRAQALNEMGLLASLGSKKVARRAMPLHSKAIEIADRLAVGDDPLVSQQAKQLLVEAHLAVAVEISLGDWQQKDETVPQWIERSSALAEALIAEDAEAFLPLRLQVAVSSLAAAANLDKPINPLLWIEEAEDTAAEIKLSVFDPLAESQYDWQLGLAYFHGSQIEHHRSEPDSAIHLGELADQQLTELAKQRDEMPDTAYLMGRLYFQIGAVHAVHYEDHSTACQWYDEAAERLLNPVPVTTMAAPQQHGDALVSMGVSYWNQDERQRAIEVTESGVELIEQAVSSSLLEAETLMVSYSNLAAMYQAQGDNEPAAHYERLAKKISGAQVSGQKIGKQSTTSRLR